MNRLELKGNGNEIKGKLKQKYGGPTDCDLMFVERHQGQNLGRAQKRLGRTEAEGRREIESL